MNQFIPNSFNPPESLRTEDFYLRMLTVNDVVKEWIDKEWPFKNPAYPGREISWEAYLSTMK